MSLFDWFAVTFSNYDCLPYLWRRVLARSPLSYLLGARHPVRRDGDGSLRWDEELNELLAGVTIAHCQAVLLSKNPDYDGQG